MKKTISINLGGQVFQIDEDAYEILERYLNNLKAKYESAEGGAEIVGDIEARLAEMFYERMGSRTIITLEDVDQVTKVMGQPEDFGTDEETEEELFENSSKGRKERRRLFRDPDDSVVEGVLAGLSAYLGISDPIWLRLLFVLFLFTSFGTAAVIYIILVMIIPKAKTASEKLQMRGEPINVDNIERTIKDGMNDLKDNLNGSGRRSASRGANAFQSLMQAVIQIVVLIAKFVGKFLGFLLIIGMLAVLTGLILCLVLPSTLTDSGSLDYFYLLFDSSFKYVLAITALILVAGIPILSMMMLGVHLLIGRKPYPRGFGWATSILWTLGFILGVYSIANISNRNSEDGLVKTTMTINDNQGGTLYLQLADLKYNDDDFDDFWDKGAIRVTNDSIFMMDNITLDVVESRTSETTLDIVYMAEGKTRDEAYNHAATITYAVQQDSNLISFPLYCAIPNREEFHFEKVKMTLKIPVGSSIYLHPSIRPVIYDIKNVTNTYDGKMVGHTWKMLPEGLTCMDCDFSKPAKNDWSADDKFESLDAAAFDALVLTGFVNYEIIGATSYRLETTGDYVDALGNMMSQQGTTLRIDASGKGGKLMDNDRSMKVKIYTPELKTLTVSGATSGKMRGISGDELNIVIEGFSACDFDVEVERLNLDVDAASSIELSGIARELTVNMDGAAQLLAYNLITETAKIDMDGACKAEVNASEKLVANLDGLCKLSYKGQPQILSDVSGFSSIKPAE